MHDSTDFFLTLDRLGYGAESVSLELLQRPEHRLMLAVLHDAVSQFCRFTQETGRRKALLFREARDWLWDTHDKWPFSSVNICDALGIDHGFLLRGLQPYLDGQAAPWSTKQGVSGLGYKRHKVTDQTDRLEKQRAYNRQFGKQRRAA